MNPNYPIYIISKGRWKSRMTSKTLEQMDVPYRIVVEPQEFKQYSKVIDPKKILVLPFSNLNQGSIPARNWVWEHSIQEGHKKHWIMDDNIGSFRRLNNNLQVQVTSGTILKCAEDFTDRYINVALSGLQYDFFLPSKYQFPAVLFNTRIYSCTLIRNNIPYRWRGKYNEDTDLSLRVLKDGWCTILFNAFIQEKKESMGLSGGNTDELYKNTNNRKEFAESLQKQHPDVVEVVWRYNRWHHKVNYKPFKNNRLIKKEGLVIPDRVNNYGMVLKKIGE
jgi:hypothetical protein